jgi:hypothetical protein
MFKIFGGGCLPGIRSEIFQGGLKYCLCLQYVSFTSFVMNKSIIPTLISPETIVTVKRWIDDF